MSQTHVDCVLPSTTLAACPGFRVSSNEHELPTLTSTTVAETGTLFTTSEAHQHGTGRSNDTTSSTSSIVVLTVTNSNGDVITSTASLSDATKTTVSSPVTPSTTTPSAASAVGGRIMGLGLLLAVATSVLLSF